jgi:hypothetical protein
MMVPVSVIGSNPDRVGDAEVHHLHEALGHHHHVARLHVAVHDPLGVGGGERLGDLRADGGGLAGREHAARLERLP